MVEIVSYASAITTDKPAITKPTVYCQATLSAREENHPHCRDDKAAQETTSGKSAFAISGNLSREGGRVHNACSKHI
jgi:hypothetical protein